MRQVFVRNAYYCSNRTGGALRTSIRLDALPAISMEDTVHDSSDVGPPHNDEPKIPEKFQAQSEKEVIGQPASIAYHLNLKQLAEYLVLPIPMCTAKDPVTFAECQAPGPFQVKVKSRATAAIIEWVGTCVSYCVFIMMIIYFTFCKYHIQFHGAEYVAHLVTDSVFIQGPYNNSFLSVTILFQMCPFSHIVWNWSSQSKLKYAMQVGDFSWL